MSVCSMCGLNRENTYILNGKMYDSCISCFFKLTCGIEITIRMIYECRLKLIRDDNTSEDMLDFVDFMLTRFYEDCR